MIEINILRERQTRFQQRRAVFNMAAIYIGSFAFVVILVGIYFLANNMQIARMRDDITRLRGRIAAEAATVERLKLYQSQMENLAKKLEACRIEADARVLWARKVALIGESLPPGVYLNRIAYVGSVDKSKGDVFAISGYVYPSTVSGKKAISNFAQRLRNNAKDEFASVTLMEVRREKQKSDEMLSFKIECAIARKGQHK